MTESSGKKKKGPAKQAKKPETQTPQNLTVKKVKASPEVVKNFGGLSDDDQMKLLFQVFPVDTKDIIKGDPSKSVADAVMPVKAKS